MKQITKYYNLILLSILSVKTLIDYIDYRKTVKKIDVEELPIDTLFGGWYLVFFFFMLCLLEKSLKNEKLKLIIRIYLTIILTGLFLVRAINIDNLYAGIANTLTITGVIAVFTLVLKMILKKVNASS